MTKKIIYLAGPIANCTDGECHAWRAQVMNNLGVEAYYYLNPMRNDYRGYTRTDGAGLMQPEDCTLLVENDLADLKECDIVFANCWKTSVGTSNELVYAKLWKKYVIAVCPEQYVSPWIQYHANRVTKTVEHAIKFLQYAQENRMLR